MIMVVALMVTIVTGDGEDNGGNLVPRLLPLLLRGG
jgi:hypothetical protein